MWFEWKLLHKWYFKETKVMKEYAELVVMRALVVFDIEIISFLILKSIFAWKLHDVAI